VAGSPVVVYSASSSCCLCHVAKRLLRGMGASPRVVEMDELDGAHAAALGRLLLGLMGGQRPAVPAVFVGGRLIGGLDRLMSCHISGALIPQLKAAGALWL
jgi:glutaredoxin 3